MSVERDTEGGGPFSSGQISVLRAHRTAMLEMPARPETFAVAEIPTLTRHQIIKLRKYELIERAERERLRCDAEKTPTYGRWRYRVCQHVHEWAARNLQQTTECPAADCHATGIRNRPGASGAEAFTCTNDDCSETFNRAVAAEVSSR